MSRQAAREARAAVNADLGRKLKIKTGICQRITKEVNSYKKEAQQQEEKIQRMKDSGADAYDIKKQEEVLVETKSMIPDSLKRLDAALKDLNLVLAEVDITPAGEPLRTSEDYNTAKLAAESASAILAN